MKVVKVNVCGSPSPGSLAGQPIPEGLNWDYWLGPNTEYSQYNHELVPEPGDDFWGNWRNYNEFGGGDMTDWGAHMFDIAQWALDKDDTGPAEINPPDGKDHMFLTYRYDDGSTITHEDFGIPHAVRFIGSEGQIDVARGMLKTDPIALKDKVIGPDEEKVYKSENHYQDWLDAIRDRSKPMCDVETGHRTATICNIGNIAYRLKEPLQWNPEKERFKSNNQANSLLGREMRDEWRIKM
jgi:predicted dehydrogenase